MVIHLSLHESVAVIGMPIPEMKKIFTLCCQIINSMESVGMECSGTLQGKQKISYAHARSIHGDEHLREGEWIYIPL